MSPCSRRMTTAVAPAARSVSSGLADASAKLATALAVTVLSSGPGNNAAAAASTTQAMSARVPSWPPTWAGRWTAWKPLPTNSCHQEGNSPLAIEPNAARVLSMGACRAAKLLTASTNCSCSAVIASVTAPSPLQPENSGGVAVQELRPDLILQRNIGHVAEDPL